MITYLNKGKNEHSAGILVVGNNRKIVSLNRTLIDMWQIPKGIVGLQDDDIAIDFVSQHFESSKAFIREVRELYAQPEIEIHDTISLRNGRIFERHSMPQWLKDENVGRIWIFREIVKPEIPQILSTNENQIVNFHRFYQWN